MKYTHLFTPPPPAFEIMHFDLANNDRWKLYNHYIFLMFILITNFCQITTFRNPLLQVRPWEKSH